MTTMDYPPVADLVPHSGALVLLDQVLDATDDSLLATLTVRADGLYNQGDLVPAWLGLEYMSQAIAAWAGLRARLRGEPVPVGFLLGSRRYHPACAAFIVGATLTVRITRVLGDDAGMGVFDCQLREDSDEATLLINARLNVFQPSQHGKENT